MVELTPYQLGMRISCSSPSSRSTPVLTNDWQLSGLPRRQQAALADSSSSASEQMLIIINQDYPTYQLTSLISPQ